MCQIVACLLTIAICSSSCSLITLTPEFPDKPRCLPKSHNSIGANNPTGRGNRTYHQTCCRCGGGAQQITHGCCERNGEIQPPSPICLASIWQSIKENQGHFDWRCFRSQEIFDGLSACVLLGVFAGVSEFSINSCRGRCSSLATMVS
jgi:hypothetical protein